MALYGIVGEFKESEESWIQYVERLEQYFLANEITDGKKQRAILLSVCGSKTYGLLRDILQPKKPADTDIKVIFLRNLSEHCNFGESLEDMLRDRLVCGINNHQIQKRLLAETVLNFQKAVELALAMESASRSVGDLHMTKTNYANSARSTEHATSYPGSLLLSSGRDPGCGWSRASQILGGKFNCNCERGGKGACL